MPGMHLPKIRIVDKARLVNISAVHNTYGPVVHSMTLFMGRVGRREGREEKGEGGLALLLC
jgi:hypothetical protein